MSIVLRLRHCPQMTKRARKIVAAGNLCCPPPALRQNFIAPAKSLSNSPSPSAARVAAFCARQRQKSYGARYYYCTGEAAGIYEYVAGAGRSARNKILMNLVRHGVYQRKQKRAARRGK